VLPEGVENEQYLSGHSWLLRGLCEHYAWKGDQESLGLVKRIVKGLVLPAKGRYAGYPIRAEDRPKTGGVAGNITHTVNGWELSSDVGCAFIMLDGATRAWEVAPSPELEGVIREMIARYGEIDLVKVGAQTHATLSAMRGVLRFYATHRDPAYLELVKRNFGLYWEKATTEHYANYNWFGRPEWTEACAVVDSMMLAEQLYGVTGEVGYLEDAQLIYYNALCHAQRPNGGFGCDVCTGANEKMLEVKAHAIYEAPFCCSMRGAEGLTAAGTYSYLVGESGVMLPFYFDNTATLRVGGGVMKVMETTGYPLEGSVSMTVLDSTANGEVEVSFFVPSWVPAGSVKVVVNDKGVEGEVEGSFFKVKRVWEKGDQVRVSFDEPLRRESALHPKLVGGRGRYFQGPMLLSATGATTRPAEEFVKIGAGRYRAKDGGELAPIGEGTYWSDEQVKAGRELLFAQ
jgi:hypothetical protein